MTHFDPKRETELITDASTIGLAYKLQQYDDKDKLYHPILYGSRKLRPAEKNYTTTELECLSLIEALKKNRQFLTGMKFKAITDHKALRLL